MVKNSQRRRPFLALTAPRTQEIQRRLAEPVTVTQAGSEALDNALEASKVVLKTLGEALNVQPLPLPCVVNIAVDIVSAVQGARQNKKGFKGLADDALELACAINKVIPQAEDVPSDLDENLTHLIETLDSIRRFALKSSSRNFFLAMLCIGADAVTIRRYRERLQHSMEVFHIQSDIMMRVTVARLVSQYAATIEELRKRATAGTSMPNVNASASAAKMAPPKISGEQNKGLIVATTIPADGAVSKTSSDISTEARMKDGMERRGW